MHTSSAGVANSRTFKTRATYVAQPVLASTPEVMKLVELYVFHVRPYAALVDEDVETARLFITANGKPDVKLERYVKSLFLTEMDCRISTNTIRKIVDTTARDMRLRGDLSAAQMDAVLFVQGHSEKISRNYYIQ